MRKAYKAVYVNPGPAEEHVDLLFKMFQTYLKRWHPEWDFDYDEGWELEDMEEERK